MGYDLRRAQTPALERLSSSLTRRPRVSARGRSPSQDPRAEKRVHLVLAAPNSVIFTFGRRYDKRNLPEIIVYQYQRGEPIAYPWGVSMPVAGLDDAKVMRCAEPVARVDE